MSGSGPRRRCGGRWPETTAAAGDYDCGNGYVEVDPTGRYGRFDDLLGKGAMKSVYRGFDEELGVEVAWNQASLGDVLRTPDALRRMRSEVALLRALRHDAIIGFHASWVDARRRTFNFITELFSSGTLRSYRLRHPRVSARAVRSWARQVLRGVAYLHARDPPVIHRDLKCDNLFVNGHRGQVKIGDLGLAAVLRSGGGVARSVIGTPEFMAPEMYDEEYDERVDVYAFGMCVLEMVTVEYPYAECSNPAQIYKKVTTGRLPDAFYRVEDDDARRFIGRCLVAAPQRPSASELLLDPFLLDDDDQDPRRRHDTTTTTTTAFAAAAHSHSYSASSLSSSLLDHEDDEQAEAEQRAGGHDDDVAGEQPPARTDMTITGKLNAEEDTVFLKVQIADGETGHVRNIYFPFDMASDTAAEVASEMVKELDIADRDASEIAAMIEEEVDRLLPGREQQHEYTYAAHDDDGNGAPFCYLSSSPTSSSQGSLCGVGPYGTGGFCGPHGGGWTKADHWCALSDDDDGASSSSSRYSALRYEEEEAQAQPSSSPEADESWGPAGASTCSSKAGQQAKNTRFGPGPMISRQQLQRQGSLSPAHPHMGRPRRREREGGDGHGRMPRNRSMVDMRSRLLHRTLVEELNRRLFFNTVGAVENIGFRAPAASSSAAAAARGGCGRRRGKDDSQ